MAEPVVENDDGLIHSPTFTRMEKTYSSCVVTQRTFCTNPLTLALVPHCPYPMLPPNSITP